VWGCDRNRDSGSSSCSGGGSGNSNRDSGSSSCSGGGSGNSNRDSGSSSCRGGGSGGSNGEKVGNNDVGGGFVSARSVRASRVAPNDVVVVGMDHKDTFIGRAASKRGGPTTLLRKTSLLVSGAPGPQRGRGGGSRSSGSSSGSSCSGGGSRSSGSSRSGGGDSSQRPALVFSPSLLSPDGSGVVPIPNRFTSEAQYQVGVDVCVCVCVRVWMTILFVGHIFGFVFHLRVCVCCMDGYTGSMPYLLACFLSARDCIEYAVFGPYI